MTNGRARLGWLAALAAACGGPPGPAALDLDGRAHHPLAVAPGRVHVLVFVSQECPIANAYAPRLAELAAASRGQPVDWFLVHVDPDLGPAAARQHAQDYALPGTVLLDPHHRLAAPLGITRTPEAAVLTAAGLRYRGRIDDQWHGLGARGQAPSQHDLQQAIAAALAAPQGPLQTTPAVGCLLPEPRR